MFIGDAAVDVVETFDGTLVGTLDGIKWEGDRDGPLDGINWDGVKLEFAPDRMG